MGAYVSLAFGIRGSKNNLALLDSTLIDIGLKKISKISITEGTRQTEWQLHFAGEEIPITCRCYQENGWVSTTLDIEEELFESFERQLCDRLVRKLINVAIKLMQKMNLSYVFFEEEAEADIDPSDYNTDYLYAITLLSNKVSSLQEACSRSEVQRVEQFDGGVVLYLRFPIPHYQPN